MKKSLTYLIPLTILLMSILPLSADPKYGMAGCGLGTLAIKENGFEQVFAATLNSISANQTSGITTGTLGCTSDGVVNSNKEQEIFVHMNIESLEQEMAMGKGEKLSTLATLFGCTKDSQKSFASMTQKKYGILFTNNIKNSPSDLISAIKTEILKDNTLATSCKI